MATPKTGENLKICVSEPGEAEDRPKNLDGGKGSSLRVLKREEL
jgi:hypothetical protein